MIVISTVLIQGKDILLKYLAASPQEHNTVTTLSKHEEGIGQNEKHCILGTVN